MKNMYCFYTYLTNIYIHVTTPTKDDERKEKNENKIPFD
jgi:hypothetical protein